MNFSGALKVSPDRFAATGLIIHQGGLMPITVNWPLMILDGRSLARSWSDKLCKNATGAGVAGNPDLAVALAREAAVLETWLRDPQVSVAAWPELAIRQAVSPLTVGRVNLSAYAATLADHPLPQDYVGMNVLPNIDFLLAVGMATLTVTRRWRVMALHTGARYKWSGCESA